jgi:hypothetical protein
MLLVYGSDRGVDLKIKMDSRRDKYNVSKILSAEAGYEKICEEIAKHDAVILNEIPAQLRNDLLKFCYRYRLRAYVAPKLTDVMIRCGRQNNLFDTPLILVKGTGLSPMQRILKRTMDNLFGQKAQFDKQSAPTAAVRYCFCAVERIVAITPDIDHAIVITGILGVGGKHLFHLGNASGGASFCSGTLQCRKQHSCQNSNDCNNNQ